MILVFGKTGQVARELALQAPDALYLDRHSADLTDPEACRSAILAHKPSAVINAAAYTAVDKAEDETALARLINTDAPIAMAQACATLGIPFVHISTDYVFDGSGIAPFAASDTTDPINMYGQTKYDGEVGIAKAGGSHAILRTSWVFSSHGNNFVKTMVRLAKDRLELSIVSDQIGGPTPARAIAHACLKMANTLKEQSNASGTYHFSGAPNVSWAEFAREIFKQSGHDTVAHDILTADYPTPAKRPLNSRLNCASLEQTFGILQPDWAAELNDVLKQMDTA